MKDVSFRSAALGRETRYRIYLPPNYAAGQKRYPVLYLLHGFYGNFTDWDKQSHLRAYAKDLELIIVMPDGDDSWYVNSPTKTGERFEDYIVRELIAEVEGRFRAIGTRESRAIAGDSMGGYGALNLALKHPELYIFAGDLSGALNAPADLGRRQPAFQASLLAAFGPPGDVTRTENDVYLLLARAEVPRLPYFYLSCGESDVFRELNHQFAEQLEARHAHYEAHEQPGGHDWKFWDQAIKDLLPVMMRKVNAASSGGSGGP